MVVSFVIISLGLLAGLFVLWRIRWPVRFRTCRTATVRNWPAV
jgi:hypothetical protein